MAIKYFTINSFATCTVLQCTLVLLIHIQKKAIDSSRLIIVDCFIVYYNIPFPLHQLTLLLLTTRFFYVQLANSSLKFAIPSFSYKYFYCSRPYASISLVRYTPAFFRYPFDLQQNDLRVYLHVVKCQTTRAT